MHHLFFKNEVVADEVYKDVKQGITTSTGQVAEGFFINQCFEWRIKKINGIDDQILQNEGAKVILSLQFAPVGDMALGKTSAGRFMNSQHGSIEIPYP